MTTKHVFLSYAREDRAFAQELSQRLRRSQVTPWQDLNNLKVGVPWQAQIDNALRGATALIVVMSPHATKSPYVTYEWAFALGAGVMVIPVVKRQTTLHPRLAAIQTIDFTKRKAWVSLWNALPFVRRKRRVIPTIRAGFLMNGGVPERTKGGYTVSLWIDAVPRNTRTVVYEIHDETMKRLKWVTTNASTRFGARFQCDGDVLITARIRTDRRDVPASATLLEALLKTHGRSSRTDVRQALDEIREN